jgi:hypothetical protein
LVVAIEAEELDQWPHCPRRFSSPLSKRWRRVTTEAVESEAFVEMERAHKEAVQREAAA